jgi:hypothetical protein
MGFEIATDVYGAASVIRERGGVVFWGPEAIGADGRRMAVGVLTDRHVFEVVEGAAGPPRAAVRLPAGEPQRSLLVDPQLGFARGQREGKGICVDPQLVAVAKTLVVSVREPMLT